MPDIATLRVHSAARVGARAAMIEALQRSAVIGIAERRACPEQLIERQCTMENIAATKPEGPLQIERAERLPAD